LPEVITGDYLWLDDIQEDVRYEARITSANIFQRGQGRVAVLKMSLRLPTDFSFYRGAQFILRFRLNRVTLRRQYHALAHFSASLRRLLFPSTADIKPMQHPSRAEINKLDLVNENIRNDDRQLQTIVSIIRQPKGSVPFIIFGPCAHPYIPSTAAITDDPSTVRGQVKQPPSSRALYNLCAVTLKSESSHALRAMLRRIYSLSVWQALALVRTSCTVLMPIRGKKRRYRKAYNHSQ
jgi:hypothetical protein